MSTRHQPSKTGRPGNQGGNRSLSKRLREILRANPDGADVRTLVMATGASKWSVPDSLAIMPDAYIDRWYKDASTRGQWASVWCVVPVPENCPKPNTEIQRP